MRATDEAAEAGRDEAKESILSGKFGAADLGKLLGLELEETRLTADAIKVLPARLAAFAFAYCEAGLVKKELPDQPKTPCEKSLHVA